MKNITKALGIAGIFGASFLPLGSDGQENVEKKTEKESHIAELVEFNSQNKQVYEDFRDLIKEKGAQSKFLGWIEENGIVKGDYEMSRYDNYVYNYKDYTFKFFPFLGNTSGESPKFRFLDRGSNGLIVGGGDECFIGLFYDYKSFASASTKERLGMAEEYNNLLKQIMHEAEYKNY